MDEWPRRSGLDVVGGIGIGEQGSRIRSSRITMNALLRARQFRLAFSYFHPEFCASSSRLTFRTFFSPSVKGISNIL